MLFLFLCFKTKLEALRAHKVVQIMSFCLVHSVLDLNRRSWSHFGVWGQFGAWSYFEAWSQFGAWSPFGAWSQFEAWSEFRAWSHFGA